MNLNPFQWRQYLLLSWVLQLVIAVARTLLLIDVQVCCMTYSVITSFKSHDLSSGLAYWGDYISNQINSDVLKSSNDKLSPNMAASPESNPGHVRGRRALSPWLQGLSIHGNPGIVVGTGRRNYRRNRYQREFRSWRRLACKLSLLPILPVISSSRLDQLPPGSLRIASLLDSFLKKFILDVSSQSDSR